MVYYDDEMTEHATFDFLCQATKQGRSEDFKPCPELSHRFGNLVTIYGMSGRITHYRVLKYPSGVEYVCLLIDSSEVDLSRLAGGGTEPQEN